MECGIRFQYWRLRSEGEYLSRLNKITEIALQPHTSATDRFWILMCLVDDWDEDDCERDRAVSRLGSSASSFSAGDAPVGTDSLSSSSSVSSSQQLPHSAHGVVAASGNCVKEMPPPPVPSPSAVRKRVLSEDELKRIEENRAAALERREKKQRLEGAQQTFNTNHSPASG